VIGTRFRGEFSGFTIVKPVKPFGIIVEAMGVGAYTKKLPKLVIAEIEKRDDRRQKQHGVKARQ
jgi:hypothetical protein